MTPFYSTPERIAALRQEAYSWLRTPFLARATLKGVGVDCISLCALIYVANGLLTEYKPPNYTMEGGQHLDESLLEQEINCTGKGMRIWERPAGAARKPVDLAAITQPGDLLCAQMGRVTHHAAIVLSKDFLIHAIPGIGVCQTRLKDPRVASRVHTVYRPVT